MSTHSRLAPSSAHRWIACPQSVNFTAPEGEDDSSEASREGTAAHKLGEECLEYGEDAWWYIGQKIEGVEVTAEMAARVQVRLDYVRAMGGKRFAEVKFHLPGFHPDLSGTCDDLILEGVMAFVIDYKDGFIHVEAAHNPQLMSYAWMAALTFPEIQVFELTIIQPKNEASPIRSWEISRADLELWAYTELLPAMEKAGTGDYVMGEHCKYCPRLKALDCPAHKVEIEEIEMLEADLDGETLQLSNNELAQVKERLKSVERFAKAVDDELARRLLTLGQEVPGWKVVEKKADRIWKDFHPFAAAPEEFFSKPELLSPAKVEKLPGGAQFVAEWAYKPKTGLTYAPESDKRMGVSVATLADKFGAYYKQGE